MLAVLLALAAACLALVAWLTLAGLRAQFAATRAERARRPLELRVVKRHEATDDLVCLRLECPRGRRLPPFSAGQYLLLHAPAGRDGATVRRAYSLAAWQERPEGYELAIKGEPLGAMSGWVWHELREGASVLASPPQGRFVLDAGDGPLVLVGGGVGITPMRAMLHRALESRRQVVLFHVARCAGGLLYREEFERLSASHPDFRYLPRISRPDAGWSGAIGRLDASRLLEEVAVSFAPRRAEFYLCAGAAMMDSLRAGLIGAGVDAARIRHEAFGTVSAGVAGLSITVNGVAGIRRIETKGEPTLLASLEANGVDVLSECRAGSCGLCEMRVERGEVRWLVDPDFRVRSGRVLPCVCVPEGDLSLAPLAE